MLLSLPIEVKQAIAGLARLPGGVKALGRAFTEERSYLVRSRWIESMASQSPDFGGERVPWFNYGMVRLLRGRVKSTMRVFEYGSGFSTLWWAKHAQRVAAIEHHQGWADQVAAMIAEQRNASVTFVPLDYDGAYCRAVLQEPGPFDVVVVDGRDRVNCMTHALERLSDNGVIVFDNSQREKYRAGIEAVKATGWRELQLSGMAPMTWVESYTSILYRAENCFEL